jgi:hypothetical protein
MMRGAVFNVRLQLSEPSVPSTIVLRNSVDGWAVDLHGVVESDAYVFTLDEARYAAGMEFKFVLDGHRWMRGENLSLVPRAGGDYRFDERQVRFEATDVDVRRHGSMGFGAINDGPAGEAGAGQAACSVSGTVRSPDRPAGVGSLRVKVVERSIGGDATLAETVTDEQGRYTVSYQALDSGTARPDLETRVYSGETEIGRSEVRYEAGTEESVDVRLAPGTAGLPSEFESLERALAARFSGFPGALGTARTKPDIAYLATKTGLDPEAVQLDVAAHSFAQRDDVGEPVIPPSLYYALFRAGLPVEASSLYRTAPQAVLGVWKAAIGQGVIPAESDDTLNAAVEEFLHLGVESLAGARAFPGSSTVRELARGALGDDEQRHAEFANILVRNRADPGALWQQVWQSLGPDAASRLEVDAKLALLTSDNAPLIERLHQAVGSLSTVEQLAPSGFYRPERWAELIADDVPDAVPGDNPEQRRARYAQLLADHVRTSFPTAVVAAMLGAGELPVTDGAPPTVAADGPPAPSLRERAQAFLAEHQAGFDIGAEPLSTYLARNPSTVRPDEQVQAEITRVQRVYQITPTDEALSALLSENLDSAYRVTQHSEGEFIRMLGDRLGDDVARLTYAKAVQVHNTVLNVATGYLNARRAPGMGSSSALPIVGIPQQAAKDAAQRASVLAYPTLDDLFGSVDYCECEHCRSILSPAAYLVDLLTFLDHPVNGMSPQALLLQRRPDLQNLPLTCENTNVVLPYIDVVNETLEHYVAHGSLSDYAGHDTGEIVTTEELLASPQFVEEAAYLQLQQAVFPPPMPFHKALETSRRYLQRLGTPLVEAMKGLLQPRDAVTPPAGGGYGWRDIYLEHLTMSRQECELLVGSATLQQLYGYPADVPLQDVVTQLRSVRTFTRRTAVTVTELTALLRTAFVNPDSVLLPRLERLHVTFADMRDLHDGILTDAAFRALLPAGLDPAEYGGDVVAWVKDPARYARIMGLIVITSTADAGDPCSVEPLELRLSNPDPAANSLDAAAFTRLLRFLRLWRRLGWTMEETDAALGALLPGGMDEAGLSRLGSAVEMLDRLGLSRARDLDRLLSCWAPISTRGPASLYRSLFLRPSSSPPDPAFADDGYGDVLTDPAARLLSSAETLRAAFTLTGEEFGDIVADLGYQAATPLTVDTVSAVHRRGWLARTLRLSVREFLQLRRWTGLDPFTAPDPPNRPMPAFLDLLDALRAASLPPAQVLYLFWNQDPTGRLAPGDADLGVLVRALRTDAAVIDHDFAIEDDPDGALARTQMALVYGVEATDFFFGLLDPPSPVGQADIDRFFARYEELKPLFDAYVASTAPPQERRRALLAGFIPQLRHRRLAQQAVALTAVTSGVSPALTETLLTDATVLHADGDATQPALRDLVITQTPGLAADFFWSAFPPLGGAIPDATDPAAIPDYSPKGPRTLPANPTAGAPISARWSGRLEVPAAGSYSFVVETDPGATVIFSLDGQSSAPQVVGPDGLWMTKPPVVLTAGWHRVKLSVNKLTGTMRLRWQTTGQGWQPIPAPLLYSETLLSHCLITYVRFTKAASMAGALQLSPAEVGFLAGSPDYRIGGNSWLNALASIGNPDPDTARKLTTALTGLLGYVDVRQSAPTGPDELVSFLQDPAAKLPTGDLALQARLGWEPGAVDSLLARFQKVQTDLGSVDTLARVKRAYALVTTSGIPAPALAAATTNDPDADTVRGFEAAMRARYDRPALLDVLTQVNNELRILRRDALVAFILHRLGDDPDLAHIDTPDKLFELFLMDVSMDPCQQTTRIRHALSSVQLFVDRCLMGLEVGEEFAHLYRLSNSAGHFYTIHPELRDEAIGNGYRLEGVQCSAFESARAGTVPLYRLMRTDPQDHFYTTDTAAREQAVADQGYVDMGIECFVFPQLTEGVSTPLYELTTVVDHYNTTHFYTTSKTEMDNAVANLGYVYQGNACYVPIAGQTKVSPASIDAEQWEWMKRYRVWEANRKVFLWPENWLAPELRNDQSPFFTAVMSELLQGDITEERAATAMIEYLSQLEEVAQLEPCGMYIVENSPGAADDVLHLVARTPGSRRAYYYRRREGVTWTPWEPVKLDIEGNPVQPVVWNGRLFLFWLRILQRTPVDPADIPTTPRDGTEGGLGTVPILKLREAAKADAQEARIKTEGVLCWSEYYNGRWQSPKTSDAGRPVSIDVSGSDSQGFDRNTIVLVVVPEGEGLRIYVGDLGDTGSSFLFHNSYSAPVSGADYPAPDIPLPDEVRLILTGQGDDAGVRYELDALYAVQGTARLGIRILTDALPISVAQPMLFPGGFNHPFFSADSRRAYFVTSRQAPGDLPSYRGFGAVLPPTTGQVASGSVIRANRSTHGWLSPYPQQVHGNGTMNGHHAPSVDVQTGEPQESVQ